MKPGARVACYVGSENNRSYIGDGTYLGHVNVWMVILPNGRIGKMDNPEQQPDEAWMKELSEMGVKFGYGPMPKILMDDDTIRYGGNVSWEEIGADPSKRVIVPKDYPH